MSPVQMDDPSYNLSPHVRAARERAVCTVWSDRYRLARREGFSDGDARLHADQAAAIQRREYER